MCFHSNGTSYDFNRFRYIKQFGSDNFNVRILIKEAKDEQDEMKKEMTKFENYNATNKHKLNSKEEVFNNTK